MDKDDQRTLLAGLAMAAIIFRDLRNHEKPKDPQTLGSVVAVWACLYADALIAELDRTKDKP